MRTFYTIDDLVNFCKTNNFSRFSSKEHGAPLIVQSVETFEVADNSQDGLMPVKLKACHIGVNRNNSGITEEVMNRDMASFKGRPILASIIKADTGEYEFHSHDMTVGEDGEIEYVEQPVGVISQLDEPYLEYDKDEDKTYLHVNGHIFTEYSKASEILQRRRTCKCSVEIAVNEMSWNAAEDYLSIDSFVFMGVTILGTKQDGVTLIEEGMKGSKITIDSFTEKNSMFGTNYQDKLLETLDKLNNTLSNFSIYTPNKEGGEAMGDFEEVVVEETTVEEIDTEEVAEVVAEVEEAIEEVEDTSTSEDGEAEVIIETNAAKKYVLDENGNMELVFEISHEDVRYSLYQLIGIYGEEDNDWYFVTNVYDDYFIMENWDGTRFYKQSYTVDGDNVALSGDRQQMFKMMLTESEKLSIEKARENYAALEEKYNELKSFKENYDAEVARSEKNAVLESVEYAEIKDTEEFKALVADMDKYSVEEIKIKADLLFAAAMKTKFNFAAEEPKKKSVGINFNAKPNKKKEAYGGLFSEK